MAPSSVVSKLETSEEMARYVSFTCLVLTLMVLGTHQAPYHPYFHPYIYPHHQQYAAHPYAATGGHHQARFNFNTNDLNSLLIRTSTATTRTTTTSTTTITCTKSTTACDAAGTNRFPFLSGIAKRSIDGKELDDYEPSQVASFEPTAVPEEIRAPRSSPDEGIFYSPYGMLDSSLSREIHPVEASQARLLFGTTTTLTISSTVFSTTTRTLTPTCSLAGFFSQCPN